MERIYTYGEYHGKRDPWLVIGLTRKHLRPDGVDEVASPGGRPRDAAYSLSEATKI